MLRNISEVKKLALNTSNQSFFPYQEVFVVFQNRKALIVAKIINAPVTGFVNMGKVVEVEPLFHQGVFIRSGFVVIV